MTGCRRVGCTNPADMYSRYQLCEKHEKQRTRHLSYMLFGRIFGMIFATLSLVGLISALLGVNNYFDEDLTFAYNVILMIVGVVVFVRFYLRTRYVTFS